MVIDLNKVNAAIDHLAENKQGQSSLIEFRTAIEKLRAGIPSDLNNAEFLYILQRMITQMRHEELTVKGKGSAELSDAQLDAVAGGVQLQSSYFNAGVTRLGDMRQIGNLGFNFYGNA